MSLTNNCKTISTLLWLVQKTRPNSTHIARAGSLALTNIPLAAQRKLRPRAGKASRDSSAIRRPPDFLTLELFMGVNPCPAKTANAAILSKGTDHCFKAPAAHAESGLILRCIKRPSHGTPERFPSTPPVCGTEDTLKF